MKKFWLLKCIKIALLVILAVLAIGFVVMYLWNWLVPSLFGGPMISFFQALGILILCKILFGGFKKGHHHCHKCGEGGWKKHGNWKQHLKEKLESKMATMSPEEKEKFKKKFGNRCGFSFDSMEGEEDTTKKE
jgi:hypothetical protein